MPFGGISEVAAEKGIFEKKGYPTLRVNQLDAQRVNEEFLRTLINDAASTFFRHAPPGQLHRWLPELHLVLRLLLWGSYLTQQRPFPGDLLQNVKYHMQLPLEKNSSTAEGKTAYLRASIPQRSTRSSKFTQLLTNRAITLYLLFSAIIPYLWTRLQRYAQQSEWSRIAQQEQQQRHHSAAEATFPIKVSRIQRLLSQLWPFMRLGDTVINLFIALNAVIFIVKGQYRSIVDRLVRLRMIHISPSAPRHVSFEVLNRNLYWHSFTELMLVIAPLLYIPQMRAYIKRYLYPACWKIKDSIVRLFKNNMSNKHSFYEVNQLFEFLLTYLQKFWIPFKIFVKQKLFKESRSQEALSKFSWFREECPPEVIQKTLSELACVFCGLSPIVLAFQGNCGHPFCYWCVSARKCSEEQLMCAECGADIGEIQWLR